MTGKTIGPGFFESTPIKVHGQFGLAYNRPRRRSDPWTPWGRNITRHWTPKNLWDIEPGDRGRQSESALPEGTAFLRALRRQRGGDDWQTNEAAGAFFLYVAWNCPHDPRQAPKEFLDMYPEAEKIEVPPNFLPQHPALISAPMARVKNLRPFRARQGDSAGASPGILRAHHLHGCRQMGRVLDALEKSGHADNTYIIVTADHGLAVGEQGLMAKQNMYECSVRMPFMISGRASLRAGKSDSLMHQHSLFPTICDLAGLPTPATVQFPSLMPLLRGGNQPLFDSVYCAYTKFQRSVRTETHKLVVYPQGKQVQHMTSSRTTVGDQQPRCQFGQRRQDF